MTVLLSIWVTGTLKSPGTPLKRSPKFHPPSACFPLPWIDYLTLMGVRCTELDHGVRANITFRNIHCVGRWIQRNILGIDHTTSFYRPALQIIHSLMMRQHTVCINTMLLQQLIANSQRTRRAKYSLPVLVTRLVQKLSAGYGIYLI